MSGIGRAPPPRLKDIPGLEPKGVNLREWSAAVNEAFRVLRGAGTKDDLDAALTKRNAIGIGLLNTDGTPAATGPGGAPTPGPPGPPGAPAPGTSPDLTPPPTPTITDVTGGFSKLFIEWDAPVYTQGHGHRRTIIYGVTFVPGVDPDPVFGDAVVIGEAFDGRTIYAHPSELGVTWAIWLKFETNDLVMSVAPAGGVNGEQATVGKVGSSDLGAASVLAAALAPGSVTADKTLLDIGGDNLLGNNSFEVDANADGLGDGWASYNNDPGGQPITFSRVAGRISGFAQRVAWAGANSGQKGIRCGNSLGGGVRGGFVAGRFYVVSFFVRASVASAFTMGLGWGSGPETPSTVETIKNPALVTTWQRYAFRIKWTGTPQGDGALFLSVLGAATGYLEFDDVQVEEGDMLSGYQGKLALNTIVAGDGAVANLAIGNAQIGNAAVDDLKVANVSAAKLTVGDGTIGGNLKSSNYVAGVSGWIIQPNGNAEFSFAHIRGLLQASQIGAGTVTATMIDSRGLALKDATGTTVFSVNVAIGNDSAATLGFNPSFTAWGATTYPDAWGGWAGASPTKETSIVLNSPYSVRYVVAGQSGILRTRVFPVPLPAGTYIQGTVSMYEFFNNGGGKPGYLFRLYTNPALSTFVDTLVPITDHTVNGWQKMPFVAGAGGAAIYGMTIYQMASWGGMPGGVHADGSIVLFGPFTFEIVTPITAGNASTRIAAAAIGTAQVGVLTANNLTVTALSNTINGSVGSGQRVEIQTNKILVYDAANVLRVKLGDLS